MGNEKIKTEFGIIGAILIAGIIIFKIIFINEEIFIVLKTVIGLFWLFVLPGFFILLRWHENFSFMERFIISIPISAAIVGISSYYIGLLGLNVRLHTYLLPIVIMIIGFVLYLKKKEIVKN